MVWSPFWEWGVLPRQGECQRCVKLNLSSLMLEEMLPPHSSGTSSRVQDSCRKQYKRHYKLGQLKTQQTDGLCSSLFTKHYWTGIWPEHKKHFIIQQLKPLHSENDDTGWTLLKGLGGLSCSDVQFVSRSLGWVSVTLSSERSSGWHNRRRIVFV